LEILKMQSSHWKLQNAQTQLGELMDAALRGEPQRIVLPNNEAVVVISEHAYIALKASAKQNAPDFVSYLLAIPKRKRARVSER
jgi:prevent-host-death family protein